MAGQRKTFGCREILRCQEGLSDVGKLDMKKDFLMQVDFEMPRRAFRCRERGHEKRLPDAGKI